MTIDSLTAPPSVEATQADLGVAWALIESESRMLASSELADLWPQVAQEALGLIEADGVAVVCHRGKAWSLLVSRSIPPGSDNLATSAEIERIGGRGVLTRPTYIDDLTTLGLWVGQPWRSAVVVAFDTPLGGVDFRLMWYSAQSAVLRRAVPLAAIFARHVELAAHSIALRDSLTEAVSARHHIGLAQGVLMHRYGLTADRAFAVLRRLSQSSNVKVRTIADQVLQTGCLPSPALDDLL